MKKILSTALAITLFAVASQAQTADVNNAHKHMHGGAMMKDLNLSAEQKAKIKSIREAEKSEMQSMKNGGNTDTDKEGRKALRQKYKTQFDAVLTDTQKAKWAEEKKEGRTEGMGKHDHGSFGKELNLSSDQQSKLSSINSDFRTQMQAVKNNTTLSAEQKREQMKQAAKAHQASLQGLLTSEQLTQMQQEHKNRKDKNSKSSNL